MAYIASDNASTTLATGISASPAVTSLSLVDAAKFPVVNHGGASAEDWSYGTLFDASGDIETVKITRRDSSSNTPTIIRGTAAGIAGVTDADCKAWAAGTGFAIRLIAQTINDIYAAQVATEAAAAAAAGFAATAGAEAGDSAASSAASAASAASAIPMSQKAVANGVASLDDDGNVVQPALSAATVTGSVDSDATGTTQNEGDATTKIATTAFVDRLRDVISVGKTTAYVLALTDRGKSIDTTAGVTVPPNSTVAFPVGGTVTITNVGGSAITITQGSGVTVCHSAAGGVTGNRTLAAYGMATLRKLGTNLWFIAGAGLT